MGWPSRTITWGSPLRSSSPSSSLFAWLFATVRTHDAAPQLSIASNATAMSTSLWFGGQRIDGVTARPLMPGAVRSTTVTIADACPNAPFGSVFVSSTGVVPSAYGPAGDWIDASVSPSTSDDPLSIDASATHRSLAATVTFDARTVGG